MYKIMKISSLDNVAVALEPVAAGQTVSANEIDITAACDIPAGHKLSLTDIPSDADIIKYGCSIGHATTHIKKGHHVHTSNMKTNLSGIIDYTYTPANISPEPIKHGSFMGYKRPEGSAGIRNEIWIINTVGCVNEISKCIERLANERFAGKTDGIFCFPHPYGCSQMGDDQLTTQKTLAGLAKNPNAAGVLILGLGCENNNIEAFKPFLADICSERIRYLQTQDVEDEVAVALSLIGELVEYATDVKREPIDLSLLTVGLKCGGSDGFSGITGNPLVGMFSDMICSHGGSTILSEVPEMFGAETLLMNRCANELIFTKTVNMINDFKAYYTSHSQVIYENPSPGNKDGGISTLEDKSIGCTQKGGSGPVMDVLSCGEAVKTHGLNLLYGPGNDIVACTMLAASGAQLILFTTGRGTPLGGPVPTVKISTNTNLYLKKSNWIDFDAGQILNTDPETVSEDFHKYIMDIASGSRKSKNEINGYREIAIFKNGVTL